MPAQNARSAPINARHSRRSFTRSAAALGVGFALAGSAHADMLTAAQADRVLQMVMSYTNGGIVAGAAAAMSDLDGDGWPDVALSAASTPGVGDISGQGRIFSGRTGAIIRTFVGDPPGAPNAWSGFGRELASPGDVNDDDVADLIIFSLRGSAPLLSQIEARSGATGAILWVRTIPQRIVQATNKGNLWAIGDVNADGVSDVVLAYQTTGVGAAIVVSLLSGIDGAPLGMLPQTMFYDHARPAGDIDGDGTPDLVALRSSQPHAWAISGADLHVIRQYTSPSGFFTRAAVGIGDLNGDDVPEIALAGAYDCHVSSGATGALLRTVRFEEPGGFGPWGVAPAGDFDADGTPDFIVSGTVSSPGDPGVRVVSGRTGSFLRTVVSALDQSGGHLMPLFVWPSAEARDFNDDGRPDILVRGQGAVVDVSTSPEALIFFTPAPCPADANYDRVVNMLDLNLLLTQYGQHGAAPNGLDADNDHDGFVGFQDLNALLAAYGSHCGE